jgi:CRISPR-associated endoribonuclease Cas6
MRLVLRGESAGPVTFPVNYNHLVQAAIYANISPNLSSFLHDKGFIFGKRSFKLFTFSRLLGNYSIAGGRISFEGDLSLHISSPVDRFVRELCNSFLKRGVVTLGNNVMHISGVSFPEPPRIGHEVKVRTLSPVTVYSTLSAPDGKNKTYYYSPYEREFSGSIDANARRKHYMVLRKKPKSGLVMRSAC